MRRAAVAVLVLLAVVSLGSVSVAQSGCTYDDLRQGIARCASLVGEIERLACYDQLAKSCGLVTATAAQPSGVGKWQVFTETDPLDDSKRVALALYADTGTTKLGARIVLVLRCRGRKTEALISWQTYLGRSARVTWRVGDAPATAAEWSLSTDKTATFYPYDDIAFIRQLLTASRLVAQVVPYNESPITAVFDLTGLTNAIQPLREACGW